MALTKINGRTHFIAVDSIEITPVSNGRWSVTYDRRVVDGEVISEGHTFLVVGGTKSGGAANEWFCHHPKFYGEEWLPTDSMVKAVKLGAQY
jgi:hypothetical protein